MQELLDLLRPLVEIYGGKLGPVVQFISLVGSARLIMKPMQPVWVAIKEYVKGSESKKDDAFIETIESSKIVEVLKYAADYLASIKLK